MIEIKINDWSIQLKAFTWRQSGVSRVHVYGMPNQTKMWIEFDEDSYSWLGQTDWAVKGDTEEHRNLIDNYLSEHFDNFAHLIKTVKDGSL